MVVKAIHMIMMGFLYKYIIAHLINVYAIMPLLMHLHGFTHKWLYMYAYSFYLFFDFAGYSLFAIAVSYLYGINTPPNFKQPFKARNIKDFWNRWHMSLSFWFRDCVYMRTLFYMSRKNNEESICNVKFCLLLKFLYYGCMARIRSILYCIWYLSRFNVCRIWIL